MKLSILKLSLVLFTIPLALGKDLPSNVPTDGLVAYYPFIGNANDESDNGHHRSVTCATAFQCVLLGIKMNLVIK